MIFERQVFARWSGRLAGLVTVACGVGLLLTLIALAALSGRLLSDQGKLFFGASRRGEPVYYMVDVGRSLQLNVSHFPTCCHMWSPDHTQRALLISDNSTSSINLFVSDANGENVRQLTHSSGQINTSPVWSPDGERIAFVSTRSGQQDIYVVDVQSGVERRLTYIAVSANNPVWSPDGQQIAFTTYAGGSRSIWIVNADGNNLYRLPTRTSEAISPTWSPDGEQIAFSSWDTTASNIYAIRVDGSDERQLTHFSGYQEGWYPSWSLDGSQIAFLWRQGPIRDIGIMNADGSGLRRLTANWVDEGYLVWIP
jgi:Tol biopolymer transport system component